MVDDLTRIIEKAKQELQQMIDLHPQTMVLVDSSCRIQRANRSLLDLLSLPEFESVIGREMGDLFSCEDSDFFCALLEGEGGFYARETDVAMSGGKQRMLRFTVVGSGGDQAGVIVEDVTDRQRQAEDEEKEHKKEALEEVVGGLMHNINQPLTVIMMRAQLMSVALEAGTASNEELRESLHDILRLTSWVADMLRYVKNPDDYITEPYVGKASILDIKRSGQRGRDRTRTERLETLILVLDAHLPGACIHAERTALYGAFLAEKMGLDEGKIEASRRCAMLHDIGKIGVSDELLSRPEKLSDEEMLLIRKHAEKGYHLLIRCSFPEEAESVYAHHERYDGKGYPRQIAGEDIPLPARITAVADTFEVLRYGRPYQEALTIEDTVSEIRKGSGTQFDPAVVDAFVENIAEMDALDEEE